MEVPICSACLAARSFTLTSSAACFRLWPSSSLRARRLCLSHSFSRRRLSLSASEVSRPWLSKASPPSPATRPLWSSSSLLAASSDMGDSERCSAWGAEGSFVELSSSTCLCSTSPTASAPWTAGANFTSKGRVGLICETSPSPPLCSRCPPPPRKRGTKGSVGLISMSKSPAAPSLCGAETGAARIGRPKSSALASNGRVGLISSKRSSLAALLAATGGRSSAA
mmetsp:Transcript_73031/g.117746  ORF Transcript_73031/g.117746 Transcript_73031/m.117746 type:complete len:225 (+) Transcript_73031:245-919(+)